MTKQAHSTAVTVEAPDAIALAMAMAHERADAVYNAGVSTLIDRMSVEEWNAACESEALSLVADKEGVNCSEGYDDLDVPVAA
jgi:hypothetical protein